MFVGYPYFPCRALHTEPTKMLVLAVNGKRTAESNDRFSRLLHLIRLRTSNSKASRKFFLEAVRSTDPRKTWTSMVTNMILRYIGVNETVATLEMWDQNIGNCSGPYSMHRAIGATWTSQSSCGAAEEVSKNFSSVWV